eukprot:CAMPEP_0118949608 /NCGR_PEP_ID=MMETSP1169-20130426/49952_1 /TAXON_ID=36882 /ORGANISM="Pyramimonas obovata, Strain CCMP722" /LENGTH=216 /DNA_ID=CAMNT_0006896283 /DNA_START=142 /DNA_END=789 /DNA_ORIENTATION=+
MLRAFFLVSLITLCQRLQPAIGLPTINECKRVGGISSFRNPHVCCAATCGRCGGENCQARPGGAEACCGGRINSNRRMCSQGNPPCLVGFKRESTGGAYENRVISTLHNHYRSQATAGQRHDLQALKNTVSRQNPFISDRGGGPDGVRSSLRASEQVALVRQRIAQAKLNMLQGPLPTAQKANDGPESLLDELKQFEGKPDLWYDFNAIWDLLPKK